MINVEQARIAEEAGAVAVMALERIPADIRVDGGVARMSDPKMIREIKAAVSIPVMAKVCRCCFSRFFCYCAVVGWGWFEGITPTSLLSQRRPCPCPTRR